MPIARKTGPAPTVAQLARFGDLTRELALRDEADVHATIEVSPNFGCPMLVLYVPETPWIEVDVYDPAGSLEISGNLEWAAVAVDTREGHVDVEGLVWDLNGATLEQVAENLLGYLEDLQNGRVVLS